MRLLLVVSFAFCTVNVRGMAEEKLAPDGRSPDGQFEVRISHDAATEDPYAYGVHVQSLKDDKRVFTVPGTGGYLAFAAALERDRAYWHASGRFVAITDQGTRHSRELYLVGLGDGKPTLLVLPDFVQNALGRVGAVETDFADVVNPQRWEGDDLILELYITANSRRAYTFEIILHVKHSPMTTPGVELKSVTLLKKETG